MHQIQLWLGLFPRPRAGGAHSALLDPQLDLNGPNSNGREGEQGSGGDGGFFLYLSIHGLQKGPGKFFMGVLESYLPYGITHCYLLPDTSERAPL